MTINILEVKKILLKIDKLKVKNKKIKEINKLKNLEKK